MNVQTNHFISCRNSHTTHFFPVKLFWNTNEVWFVKSLFSLQIQDHMALFYLSPMAWKCYLRCLFENIMCIMYSIVGLVSKTSNIIIMYSSFCISVAAAKNPLCPIFLSRSDFRAVITPTNPFLRFVLLKAFLPLS